MDFDHPEPGEDDPSDSSPGCLSQLGWQVASFILPVFSLRFYRIARRKPFMNAVVFFSLFASVLSLLSTLRFSQTLDELDAELQLSFTEQQFPTITIQNGLANVDAVQPLVILDQGGQFFALDTSGVYTTIDPTRYREGILLTRTKLQVLNSTGEQNSLPLQDLNDLFDTDPIVIDENFVLTAWGQFSRAAVIISAIVLWVWHFMIRLVVLSFVALLVWWFTSVLRSQMDYVPVLITGMYAIVPVLYLHYLLGRTGIAFPGFQTMLLMTVWLGILLVDSTYQPDDPDLREEPLLRMAPVGIPMLLVLAWDVIFTPDINALAVWTVPALTFIILIVMRRVQVDDDPPQIEI